MSVIRVVAVRRRVQGRRRIILFFDTAKKRIQDSEHLTYRLIAARQRNRKSSRLQRLAIHGTPCAKADVRTASASSLAFNKRHKRIDEEVVMVSAPPLLPETAMRYGRPGDQLSTFLSALALSNNRSLIRMPNWQAASSICFNKTS